jgi:hydroxyacylglutathione hydrolase
MIFERIEVKGLAHYSYIVGCERAGRIAIVDPKRDVDTYLDFAARGGLKITHVLETHIHADYASGARELGERAGAPVCVSAYDRGELFEVAFPHRDLHDDDAIEIGSVRIVVRHTPGHTPEHVSFLVYDTPKSSETPSAVLSGDFVFVGSLGRPDLLGAGQTNRLAASLYDSVRGKLVDLPDEVSVFPAHGAGSMCGAGMSNRACSTLAVERRSNPYFDPRLTRDAFIARLLASTPPFPAYYRRMKALNAAGAPTVGNLSEILPLDAAAFRDTIDRGGIVIDTRGEFAYGDGHIPGSFGIGLGPLLAVWAAWVVPYETPILLVTSERADVAEAARGLRRTGLDDVHGYLDGGFESWRAAGFPVRTTRQIEPAELYACLKRERDVRLIDVRTCGEFDSGHVDGAENIMGGELPQRLGELRDEQRPIAVMCAGGYRSMVAASVLERAGFERILNVMGGMRAWALAGLPTTA